MSMCGLLFEAISSNELLMTSTKVTRQHANESPSPRSNSPSLEGITGQVHTGLACLTRSKPSSSSEWT